jgi:hypothetical protein
MSQKKIIIAQFSRDWIGFDIVLRIYAFLRGPYKNDGTRHFVSGCKIYCIN